MNDSPFGAVPPDDTPYDEATWNGDERAATKNAIRDKIESMSGGTPGGVNTQVQFNNSGAFGGDAGLTYVSGTDTLTVGTVTVVTGLNPSAGNVVDLGTLTETFKDAFFSGTVAAPIYNAGVAGTQSGSVAVHDGGIVTIFDDGNDTSVVLGPVNDGTTVLDVTGSIDADGLLVNGAAVLTSTAGDATPSLGGNLDLNEKSIVYEFGTLTADITWSGDVITAIAGENVTIGDICYLKSDGKFWMADANVEAEIKGMLVMATASITGDDPGVFLIRGLIRDDSWAWTVGAQLWVAESDGNPTETQPADAGDFVRLVGWAQAADYIWFDPDKTYIEVA